MSYTSCRWLILSVQNIYPVLQSVCRQSALSADNQADNKLSRLLILGVVGLHAVMALAMKILFFSWVLLPIHCVHIADLLSYAVAGAKVGPDLGNGPLDT